MCQAARQLPVGMNSTRVIGQGNSNTNTATSGTAFAVCPRPTESANKAATKLRISDNTTDQSPRAHCCGAR